MSLFFPTSYLLTTHTSLRFHVGRFLMLTAVPFLNSWPASVVARHWMPPGHLVRFPFRKCVVVDWLCAWVAAGTVFPGHTEGPSLLHGVEMRASAFTTEEVKGGKCRVSKSYPFNFVDEAARTHSRAEILEGPGPTARSLVAWLPWCQNGFAHKYCVHRCHRGKWLVCSTFFIFYLCFTG